ncbi:HK97 gp10 family phage protein [Peptostreptococcus faecalis]|uniref:HK97 gp10 family phage protein n=1 Tax=Peptostreptococcus faecalis TaxID=2045015 RepID=UPI000C7CF1AE|nr:HK97 gp10 family phage protein [Peptostreptococcus faecalis]
MAKLGDMTSFKRQFEQFNEKVQKLDDKQMDALIKRVARMIATRVLYYAIKDTPTDTGHLRRGWGGGVESSPQNIANGLSVKRKGNEYVITVSNLVEYASYVEYGHRTRGGKGWIDGQFMLKIAVDKVNARANSYIQKEVERELKKVFK